MGDRTRHRLFRPAGLAKSAAAGRCEMPTRKVMIDAYLAGTLPALYEIPLEEQKPGMMEKLRGVFTKNPFAKEEKKLDMRLTYAGNQDLLDTLWGYYFATSSHLPILRIMQMLPWSRS